MKIHRLVIAMALTLPSVAAAQETESAPAGPLEPGTESAPESEPESEPEMATPDMTPTSISVLGQYGTGGTASYGIESDAEVLLERPDQDMNDSVGGLIRAEWHEAGSKLGVSVDLGYAEWSAGPGDPDPFSRISLTAMPRLRLAPDNDRFELYTGLAFGLSINSAPDDEGRGEFSTGIGGHVGGLLGTYIMLTDVVGLHAEGGVVLHATRHELLSEGNDDEAIELAISTYQWTTNVGLTVRLGR